MPIIRRSSGAPNRRSPRVLPRPWRLVVVLAVVLGLAVPARAADPTPAPTAPGLTEFMGGLAQQESGGRYDARNRASGAYGKYQIMPSNWPAWARRYLHFTKAPQTPQNQDRVAAGKLTDLYNALGAWDRTAYWWLTGKRGPRATWSAYASHYVGNVMLGYRILAATPPPGGVKVLNDSGGIIRYAGAWKTATDRAYVHGDVHYSKAKGAAVGVRFFGRSIRIEGPRGPTRGQVAVYVDGRLLKVVDLRARSFRPRSILASVQWAARGEHWVELRNLATRGRPYVAIDRVVIRG
jgi:hypothetical protein